MYNTVDTLNEFIIERQADFPYAKGELSRLLTHIALAAKVVNREVNQAGLVDILGTTGDINVQGETVQKLDDFANTKFAIALKGSSECCGIATEESQDIIKFDTDMAKDGKYIICIDPLDGSSNIDVNVSIGTIFSIYRRISPRGHVAQLQDFLQEGTKQVAAGYIIYGSSTMLVYTTGRGVNGFTLAPSIGEFCLSHRDIQIPLNGSIISANEGYYKQFSAGVRRYLDYCKDIDEETNRPYSSRYIGSLVADFHRNLLKGGIYMYPPTEKFKTGKLRLIYEANPMAMLVEQAGGMAVDHDGGRIMDLVPNDLHQRVPLYIGSRNMVEKLNDFIEEEEEQK
ncbi:MAG: class 1 fructose-bisphosphatase [Bacteroidales bacterium]|nr:class 1 fructose-bisphosphatase [Bacteroidales bacterium]